MNPPPEKILQAANATEKTYKPSLDPIESGKAAAPSRVPIEAAVFVWRDPTTIPRRQWLYPRTYVRKFVSATVAPGGVGKTGLGLVEALSMATGRDLLGDGFNRLPMRVWFWNGEDPLEEMERQIHAAMLHYGIKPTELGDRLFLNSGHDMPIKLVITEKGAFKLEPETVAQLNATIRKNRIDVVMLDPYVSIHSASENSNEAMDAVVKALARIANENDCAIGVHAHTRKSQAGASGELSADDARGGKALVDGARVVRVLNRMTKDEAEKAGIIGEAYRRYFWIGSDKINLTPPDTEKSWRYMESVFLPNGPSMFEGDNMRVVTSWAWPDACSDVSTADLARFQGALSSEKFRIRQSNQSPEWAGHLLADILGLDTAPDTKGKDNLSPDQKSARAKCKTVLERWQASGALILDKVSDEKRGREYQVFVVGDRVE